MNNIFKFATSELSQDALLCYWFNFATKKHFDECIPERKSAQELLATIISKWTKTPIDYSAIKVNKITRQFKNIDVLLQVNDKYLILIEDKIYTNEHTDQISRYVEELEKYGDYIEDKVIIPVYFKMIDQTNAYKDTYCLINREIVLAILKKYTFNNYTPLQMFSQNLLDIDNATNNFFEYPISEWSYNHYYGFFSSLHKDEKYIINIQYIHNQNGGFYGNWFNSKPINIKGTHEIYLMLSGPEMNGNDLILSYRISYYPLMNIDEETEENLFKQIEIIRKQICDKFKDFDSKGCPRKIPVRHKKVTDIKSDRTITLAKTQIKIDDILRLKNLIKENNEFLDKIVASFE